MADLAPIILQNGLAAHAKIADVTVTILDTPSWTDAKVEATLAGIHSAGSSAGAKAALTWVRGAAFDAHQRKVAHRWLEANGVKPSPRNTLITDSMMTRGALTAFAWLTQFEAKAFAPNEISQACIWTCEGALAKPKDVEDALRRCEQLLASGHRRLG